MDDTENINKTHILFKNFSIPLRHSEKLSYLLDDQVSIGNCFKYLYSVFKSDMHINDSTEYIKI